MFTSILSSIIIWSAVLIIALRVVTNSGIQFSNNKYISELTCYKVLHQIIKPQKGYTMRISFGILFQNYSIFVFRSDNIYVQ